MVHWLSGWLPWEDDMSDPERVAQEKNNCMSNIPLFLKQCFGDDPPGTYFDFKQKEFFIYLIFLSSFSCSGALLKIRFKFRF